jgi:DNA-binding transcriptional LysR family regulator
MLHEIETTFGARLFERSKRGVQANDLGRCVVRYARLLQSDLTHLREEFTGVLTGKGGRLRVGAIGGALPAVVVPALTLLRESQPALSVNLREDTSAGLLAALDEGRLDLAICRTTVRTGGRGRRPAAPAGACRKCQPGPVGRAQLDPISQPDAAADPAGAGVPGGRPAAARIHD